VEFRLTALRGVFTAQRRLSAKKSKWNSALPPCVVFSPRNSTAMLEKQHPRIFRLAWCFHRALPSQRQKNNRIF